MRYFLYAPRWMHLSHRNFYLSLHLFYISDLLGGNYAPDDFKRTSFRDDCDAGRQSTKGKSQSVFACLRSLVNLALPRIRQSDLQSIVYPSIATGSQRTFSSSRKRANDIATRRLLQGIRYVPGQEPTGFLLLFIRWELQTFRRVSR